MAKVLALAVFAVVSSFQESVSVLGSTMKFAWPAGTAATIETEYLREEGEPAREVSRLRMAHRMRVLAHSEGLQIQYDQQRSIEAAGSFEPAAAALLPLWVPSTIVNEGGTFSRVEEAQHAQKLFLAAIGPHLRAAEQFPALREYVATMTSAGAPAALQRGEWQKLVTQWIGMPFSMETVEVSGSASLLPGLTVATSVWLSVTNQRSCTRGRETFTCATFEMRTEFDRDGLAAAVSRLEKDSPIVLSSGITPLELEEVISVTLELGTMLPHDMLLRRVSRMRVDMNGQSRTSRDSESRRSVFVYGEATQPPAQSPR